MTTMEKMATNTGTILLARAAMIVTPLILTAGIWITTAWINGITTRVVALEMTQINEDSDMRDHETRLVSGKAARLEFQEKSQKQFEKIGEALENINITLGNLSTNVGKLETIINERVPPKQPGANP